MEYRRRDDSPGDLNMRSIRQTCAKHAIHTRAIHHCLLTRGRRTQCMHMCVYNTHVTHASSRPPDFRCLHVRDGTYRAAQEGLTTHLPPYVRPPLCITGCAFMCEIGRLTFVASDFCGVSGNWAAPIELALLGRLCASVFGDGAETDASDALCSPIPLHLLVTPRVWPLVPIQGCDASHVSAPSAPPMLSRAFGALKPEAPPRDACIE